MGIARILRNKKVTKLGLLELWKKDNEQLELLTNPESLKSLLKKKKENSGRIFTNQNVKNNSNFENNYISIYPMCVFPLYLQFCVTTYIFVLKYYLYLPFWLLLLFTK